MASMNHARELSIRASKSFADCRTHDEAFDGVVGAMNHEDADPTGLIGSSCSFVPAQPPSTRATLGPASFPSARAPPLPRH